jgi:hypothetical protein
MAVRLRLATGMVAALALLTSSTHVPRLAPPEPPADPGTVVLRLKEWRSLVGPPEWARIPEVTLLGGGRLIIPAGQAGALQRATEITLSPDRTESGPRGRVVRFRQLLSTVIASAPAAPYHPATHVALATGGFGTAQGRMAARQWPSGDLTTGRRVVQGLCTPLATLPAGLTGTARWISGDQHVWVTVRPLLPHERTCADLEQGPDRSRWPGGSDRSRSTATPVSYA